MQSYSKCCEMAGSLVWTEILGSGDEQELRSPLDGTLLQRYRPLIDAEMNALAASATPIPPIPVDDVIAFAGRLRTEMECNAALFLRAIQMEAGFVSVDCEELWAGTLEILQLLPDFSLLRRKAPFTEMIYVAEDGRRHIRGELRPWGSIAMLPPQNAFLLLAITGILNALATGNRILLRAPTQSARSAALLISALAAAKAPENAVGLALGNARQFLNAVYNSPNPFLIHYMGSARHGAEILSASFLHGKSCILDGEGNAWGWVDQDVDVAKTVERLTRGALRYNGQTCTSLNGAIIHPQIYAEMREALTARWRSLRVGNPLTEAIDVGPLQDANQAGWCLERLVSSQAQVLCGGTIRENLLLPTLVERPAQESELVRKGLYGPALWIAPGDRHAFVSAWPANHYPLSATVFSGCPDPAWWSSRLNNLARLSVNGDPSVEFIGEPWGGYPGTGNNPVGPWLDKYRRPVQWDIPYDEPAINDEMQCVE